MNKWRVLIIDDEQEALDRAKESFRDYPIEVEKAQSIVSGIRHLLEETDKTRHRYEEKLKCFDLVIVDMQLPVVKILPEQNGKEFNLLKRFRSEIANKVEYSEIFPDPDRPERYPTGGFWVIAFAVEKLKIPREKFKLYTPREKGTFLPLFGCSNLGINIYPRIDEEDKDIFKIIAKQHLEEIALNWILDKLSFTAKENLAKIADKNEFNKLKDQPLIRDVICSKERTLSLSQSFCFTYNECRNDLEFGKFIMKNLYKSLEDCLPYLYDVLFEFCHGLEQKLEWRPQNLFKNQLFLANMERLYQSWSSLKSRLPSELLDYSLRRHITNIFNQKVKENFLSNKTDEWYKSLVEIYIHYLYMRFPALLLLDWCKKHDKWRIKEQARNMLMSLEPTSSISTSISENLLEFTSRERVINYINDFKNQVNRVKLEINNKYPSFFISRDLMESILEAIEENRTGDGGEGYCYLGLARLDGDLQIIISHAKEGKELSDEQKDKLLKTINSYAIRMRSLCGLRLKMRQIGAQTSVWYKKAGNWTPLSNTDKDIVKDINFNFEDVYNPLPAEYLQFIFQFREANK